jgi:hypothetical protein
MLQHHAEAKMVLAMRCVDHGGHQSRCVGLHAYPTVGVSCRGV